MTSSLMIHPTLHERRVKNGFNGSALIFGTLWAYSEGLISQGGRLAAVDAAVGLLFCCRHPAFPVAGALLFAAKNVYCARRGGVWLRAKLCAKGYRAL